jgi:hypothetical protein
MNRLADILLIEVIRAHIASSDCPEHGLRALNDPPIASALQYARRRTTRGLPRSLADDQGR